MESTTPTPAPAPPDPPAALAPAARTPPLGLAVAVLAVAEVVLAWLALQVAEGATTCPDLGGPLGCAAVFRPRLSRLVGPVSVTQVAFVGAMASLGFAFMLNKAPPRPLVVTGLVGLGLGAGFALGLQPLPWVATGTACPLCLALAALTVGVLLLALPLAAQAGVRPAVGLVPLVVALAAVGPFAARHGARVAEDDRARAARARAASGSTGPRLVLVTQERCPYCAGLLADVLGDERVVRVLQRTRGLEEVQRGDPGAPAVEGAPTLVVLGRDGRERGRLVGYSYDPGAYATRLLTLVEGR